MGVTKVTPVIRERTNRFYNTPYVYGVSKTQLSIRWKAADDGYAWAIVVPYAAANLTSQKVLRDQPWDYAVGRTCYCQMVGENNKMLGVAEAVR